MLFNNRKRMMARLALILTLLGGILETLPVKPVHAAARVVIDAYNRVAQSDVTFPTVVTTSPQHGDVLSSGVSSVSVQFSTAMLADGTAFAVNNTSNYLLVEDGLDGKFQTTSCAGKRDGDDNQVSVNSVAYQSGTFTSTLTINNGAVLGEGSYQLLVCGSTRINDTAGNKLNGGTDSVARFLVIKDVGFDPYVNYNGSGGDGEGVGIGDFNSDGLNDVAMSLSTQVLVYLNNGSGGLNAPVAYVDNVSAEPLAVGDLNNDGRDDIVTADSYSDTIGVFLQQSDGTLMPRVIYTASTDPDAIAVGDVSGDGLEDVVVSHWNAPFIGVFIQNASGTLNPIAKYNSPQAGWDDIAIGDVNNDGRNDVVKSNGQGSTSQALSVYLQNSDGTLAGALSYSLDCSCTRRGIAIGDVTGDGLSDVVITYGGNRPASKIAVYAQGANGLSSTPVSYNAYDIPEPVELADVDLDGRLDVLTLHGGWNRLGVFLQKGGVLSPYDLYPIPYASHYEPQGLAVGDLNEDGAVDVAIADYNYGLTVLYHHTMPVPQVLIGGNTSPLDGEELEAGTNQLTVQFNRQMKADGGASAANSVTNFLLIEDGVDNTFQTTSCASGTTGDDSQVSVDSVVYDASKYVSTLSINNGEPIGVGKYRLLVCATTSIQDLSGMKLNQGLSDATITFTIWPTPHKISGNAGTAGAILSYTDGSPKIAIADGSGDYFFKVSEGWSGTVVLSKTGFTFTPESRTYTAVSSDIAGEDYAADPITFTISGNAGVGGATLSFTDGVGKTATADDTGNYSFTVSYNWTGTVTPSKPGYVFTPSSRSYSNVLANKSGEDYAAILHYTISGNVGVPGATLSYVNSGSKTVISNANGNYSFIVPTGWSGTVTPSRTGYTFSPSNRTYSNISEDQLNQDYIASPIFSTISGNVGLSGVTLSYFDGVAKTTTSDSNGNYSLLVTFNWSGTVTPFKPAFTFVPINRSYSNVQTDQSNQDFVPHPLYLISGNAGVGGAILSYTDGTPKTVTADSNGNYSFYVSENWSGTLTPSKSNYRFIPVNRVFSNVQSNQSNQDFTAQRLYIISGNAGAAGATISYNDGTPKNVLSNSLGNYSFQVPEGWFGTVTPSKTDVIFTPANRTYANVQSDQLMQNYTVTLTVFNSNDSGPGSLRQAIADALSGSTINFDPSLAGQTITLASQIDIYKDLSIDGSDIQPRVSISGNDAVHMFRLDSYTITMRSLILKNGKSTGSAPSFNYYGGAINITDNFTGSPLITFEDMDFLGNDAYQGGAIYAFYFSGKVTIIGSRFSDNTSETGGGAIYIGRGDLVVKDSLFENNHASQWGGGAISLNRSFNSIFENNTFQNNSGFHGGAIFYDKSTSNSFTLRDSLFIGNRATGNSRGGGAIDTGGRGEGYPDILENNTFYQNQSAFLGGAISSSGNWLMRNNTFSHNQADEAGGNGGGHLYLSTFAKTILYNNILANSMGGMDCAGSTSVTTVTTGSNNLVESGSGPCSTLPGTIIADPMLGPLADNGGSTQTMALLLGSPAIDAGIDANCPSTDQRGVTRPQIDHCDIGAYEFQAPVMATGETARVSLNSSGAQVLAESVFSDVSGDARYVVFESNSPNLAPGDTNSLTDIFLRDLQTGITKLVSVNSSGVQGDNYATNASISAAGRYIAFHSIATNLVSGDTNGWSDIFVHDMQTGITTRASVASDGTQSNEASFSASISADGRYIAFFSRASNLVPGDTNGWEDIFVHDMETGITTRVSVSSNGTQAVKQSSDPSISADGRYVAFYSYARNLVTGDTNGKRDIFIHDRQTGVTTRVSVDSNGAQSNGHSIRPSFSANGRYIVFESDATNLMAGDTNAKYDIFLRDLQTGVVTRVSVDSNGLQANNYSDYASISADGRYIAFNSGSTNLVSGDTNGWEDVFVRDMQLGTTTRVSVSSDGIQGNNLSYSPSISGDGQYIVFASRASNLITGDTNGLTDIFIHRQSVLPPPPVTPTFTPTATATPSQTQTPTNTPTPTNTSTSGNTPPLYLSLTGNQTIAGVTSADEDILHFDGTTWSLFFDGSDVGVGSSDLFGFSIVDSDTILMAFNTSFTLNGISVTPRDVLQFDATSLGTNTAGTFSMYLNGIDVGLDVAAENIDSVSLLPDGRVLISTTGNPVVTGVSGGRDEDILAFTPTSLGNNAIGTWAMYFDGSDVGLGETSGEDIDALDVEGGKVYLSTADLFTVSGVAGADEDVFVCNATSLGDVTACTYDSALYFDGSTWGLMANDVDAFNLFASGNAPTATATQTPLITLTPATPTFTFTPTITATPTNTPTSGSQLLPDLIISNMRIELQNTSCLAPGDPMGVRVWVTNNGQATAGIFLVNVNGAEQIINGLAVGETKAVFFSGYSNPVNAVVDSTNIVTESNKSNNARSETLPIPTPPLPCPTPTNTATATNTPGGSDLIFADGFESGSLSAWTSSATNAGDLSVSASAALKGNQGLQALINDTNTISVTDDSPNAEPRYRVRFYFDPNSISMVSGDAHFIFKGFMGTSTEVLRMEFRNSSGVYQIRYGAFQSDSSWVYGNWYTISDAPHSIELDWRAASAPGVGDGYLAMWIDGGGQITQGAVGNSGLRIDWARLGALTGIDAGTNGTYYFDAFESRRQSYIGP